MLSFFFRCSACHQNPLQKHDLPYFPICSSCYRSFLPAPPLCPFCGGTFCRKNSPRTSAPCSRPWIIRPEIDSYSAHYLLVGKSYEILKRWKSQGGFLF